MTDKLNFPSRDGFNNTPEGAAVFIQWKGTDLCADFTCECGESYHIDAMFVYAIKCTCGLTYEMPSHVTLLKIEKADGCCHHCEDGD